MRSLLVVLAAGVAAGLVVFFAFCPALLTVGNNVLMRTDGFVGFVAVLAIAASAVALVFRALLIRSDALLRGFGDRLARLEAAHDAAAGPAAAAAREAIARP